jgi:hypothetical protein
VTPPEPGCDLFVDAADPDAVLAELSTHLGVPPSYSHLSPPGFEVRVGRNRLADGAGADSDDFLDWPTLVEVSARPGEDLTTFVAALTTALRTAGHRVAAVD